MNSKLVTGIDATIPSWVIVLGILSELKTVGFVGKVWLTLAALFGRSVKLNVPLHLEGSCNGEFIREMVGASAHYRGVMARALGKDGVKKVREFVKEYILSDLPKPSKQ